MLLFTVAIVSFKTVSFLVRSFYLKLYDLIFILPGIPLSVKLCPLFLLDGRSVLFLIFWIHSYSTLQHNRCYYDLMVKSWSILKTCSYLYESFKFFLELYKRLSWLFFSADKNDSYFYLWIIWFLLILSIKSRSWFWRIYRF